MSLNNILNSDLFSELNYIDQLFASYQPPVSQQISGSIQSSTKVNTPVQDIYSSDEQSSSSEEEEVTTYSSYGTYTSLRFIYQLQYAVT